MKYDEDYGYERQRQQKVDAGLHRPQRYERHDPAPHLLFEEQKKEMFKPVSKLEWLFYVVFAATIGYALYLTEYVK